MADKTTQEYQHPLGMITRITTIAKIEYHVDVGSLDTIVNEREVDNFIVQYEKVIAALKAAKEGK